MNVTVYAKPHCPQCAATQRQLKRLGVDYREIDITQDEEALKKVLAAGFKQAPVVMTDREAWSGYRPDKIKALVPSTPEALRAIAYSSAR